MMRATRSPNFDTRPGVMRDAIRTGPEGAPGVLSYAPCLLSFFFMSCMLPEFFTILNPS